MGATMRALVVEGGGIRAAYANGVLAELEEAGAAFDAVYGTSAGGALVAWFSAGQAREALETWKYVLDERILSYRRWLLREGPLLDHDGLFEIVYEDEYPLNVDAIEAAAHPVVVTATRVDTGEGHHQDIREGNVLDWLRATGRLPIASGPPVEIEGTRYLDGGIAVPIPIQRALEDGADEVLLVLNRPEWKSEAESWFLAALVAQRYPELFDLVRRHAELWNEAVEHALDPPEGVEVTILRPEDYLDLGRLSRDVQRIEAAIEEGRGHARDLLSEAQRSLPR